MARKQETITITSGPSKFDLMLALFDSGPDRVRSVVFESWVNRAKTSYSVHLNSVEREDGSGESWNFKGTCRTPGAPHSHQVEGYFSTRIRTGTLKFV